MVTPGEVAWLAHARDDGFEPYCYVDSLAGVEIVEAAVAGSGARSRLPVLIELGVADGRTGARTIEQALAVAEAAERAPHLALVGVSGFEGIIVPAAGQTAEQGVDEFLGEIVDLTHAIAQRGWFDSDHEVIVTAGGSAFFDHVVRQFGRIELDRPARIVLRSGCYLTHDDGAMHAASPMGATAHRRLTSTSSRHSRCGASCSRAPSRRGRSSASVSATHRPTACCRW